MALPLIARAAPAIARGVMALRKGKKIKDMGMADVVDVPVLRIADAMKKAQGTSVAAKAATAAVAAAALADGAAKPSAKTETKPKAPTATAMGRRGGRIGSEPVATKPSAAATKPSAAAPNRSASAPAKSKINPLGRKLDKNGAPIIGKAELEKSGLSLRDFLNKERNLKRRDDPVKKPPLKKLEEIDVKTGKKIMAKGGLTKKKK